MNQYGFVYYLQQMRISNLDFYTRHYYKNILKEDLNLSTLYSLLKKQIIMVRGKETEKRWRKQRMFSNAAAALVATCLHSVYNLIIIDILVC